MTARGRLLSGLVTMVIALAGFVTVGALPAAANSGDVQYVALGDSYAAGVGAPPYADDICLQSNNGYPELLNSEKSIHLRANATCSGATTSEVADTQLSALKPGTRLVTVTVGGNDLGFAGLAAKCLTGTEADCRDAIQIAVGRLGMLGGDLTDLYAEVADEAPKAQIVVTGYPLLFEPPADGDPNEEIINAFNEATALLNATIKQAVGAAQAVAAARDDGVEIVYVDVTAAFEGHGIGSLDPFINGPTPGVPGAVPFHPNADGYAAYADAIATKLPNKWLDKNQQLV